MIREVALVSYLPPFMKEYETLTKTLEAENPEFVLLWEAAERVLKNTFIATADEYGISRFEKILKVLPEKAETLEERRTRLLMKHNLCSPYTFSYLKAMIASIIGKENYTIERLYDLYQIKICILNQDTRQVKNIYTIIDSLIPGNMNLLLYAEYRESATLEVKQAISITFTTEFYPRFNLPRLRLNRAWKLNGSRKLSGYDGFDRIDLYPVQMEMQISVIAKPREETGITFLSGAQEKMESVQEVEVMVSAECSEMTEEKISLQTSAQVYARAGDVRVTNLNFLDSKWKLNGKRKLNGGIDVR